MPDDYYVSQYSGEEIDALLGGAGAGTVRYDAAQTLNDAQKTQARGNIAAAPSGGGVMESSIAITAESASESYDTFCAKLDAVLATMPDASVKFLRVYPPQYYGFGFDICALFKGDNNYASVYTIGSYNKNRQGFRMVKRKLYSDDPAGQWDPLEYINPEMELGVEYRTTERYLGKPVYVQAVNFGTFPNANTKSVTWAAPGVVLAVLSVEATSSTGAPIGLGASLSGTEITATTTTLYIKSSGDYADNTAVFRVKYTKTTD